MRILEENNENIVICPHCKTKLGYTENDTYYKYNGKHILCPKCENEIVIEETKPLEFPTVYYYFGNGIDISVEEIEQDVIEGIKHLISHKEDEYWCTARGNIIIFIGYSDEYTFSICVCKNYWEADITIEEAKTII